MVKKIHQGLQIHYNNSNSEAVDYSNLLLTHKFASVICDI